MCYRAFYAVRELTTSKGQPTNAVYGVVAMLKKLLQEEKPDYCAVVFDAGEPTFRHKRYEAYKEHRAPMPEALVSQLPWIKKVCEAFRLPFFERPGFEADDLMGTIALQAVTKGQTVYLVTSDKDFFQLVGPSLKIYKSTKEGHDILDEKSLYEKWKLHPDQVVDVMALMGDDVDGIPGVPGIGEKTAVELIQKFGNVNQLFDHLEDVSGTARREALRSHQQQVRLSYDLATLDTKVPLEMEWDSLKTAPPDTEALRELYQTLEFRTLLKELQPKQSTSGKKVNNLSNAEEWETIVPEIRRAGQVAIFLEVSSPYPMEATIKAVGLAWDKGSPFSVSSELPLKELKSLFEDSHLVKICPHLKETILLLKQQGILLQGPCTDPCVASYLLDPSRSSHEVSAVAAEFLDETISESDPFRSAALTAEAALRLMPKLLVEIKNKDMETLLAEMEIPLARVLAAMEENGISLDQEQLHLLEKEMDKILDNLTASIYKIAGGEFNINSPKQLAEILFQRLKLPVIKKTKTGASTDEEVLRRLSTQHELPQLLLQYRELSKLNSTYVAALPKLVNPKTGKIHSSFHQTVTATGRLSSSNPNLQNIPIRAEIGRQIRKAFIPSHPGDFFLAADYSQIELRILAHLSQDEQLIDFFEKGEDIHRSTAAEIFHVSKEAVVADQRAAAKTINFGILYGMTPFGLAKELGIETSQASEFIERYFARYPKVRDYLKKSLEDARERGYCTTLFQRRRYIPELKSKDPVVRQFSERIAINAPIQGSAADLIKAAMISLDHALEERHLSSRMILQVHDELIFEVPTKEMEIMRSLVKEKMESPFYAGRSIHLSVPMEVKLKVGHNWFETSS